jgi:phenylpropionate dioxygenase-like ring-hydroxylating dioxygenase large terminal subunit
MGRCVFCLPAVEEKGGFVWLFFGSKDLPADARPPIPYAPELGEQPASGGWGPMSACMFSIPLASDPNFTRRCAAVPLPDDPEWRAVYEEIEFDCNHFGVFENAIDMAHIHYLHGDSFGNSVRSSRP